MICLSSDLCSVTMLHWWSQEAGIVTLDPAPQTCVRQALLEAFSMHITYVIFTTSAGGGYVTITPTLQTRKQRSGWVGSLRVTGRTGTPQPEASTATQESETLKCDQR